MVGVPGFPHGSTAVKVTVVVPQPVGPTGFPLLTTNEVQSVHVAPPKLANQALKVGVRLLHCGDWEVAPVTNTGEMVSVRVMI